MSATKKIIQWSPPRSGSTLVWQILDRLFEDPEYTENKWYQPNIVQKTHTLDYSMLNNPNYYFVTTIRNPIDCMVSFMTVNKEEFTKESIDKNINTYINYFNIVQLVRRSNNSIVLRYEQFYDDFTVIYDTLEKVFGTKIPTEKRDAMNKEFSRETNKKKADTMDDFQTWDKDSFIHGDHINSTKISYWEEKIPKDLHTYVVNKFVNTLNKLNYRKDWLTFYRAGIELYRKKDYLKAISAIEKSVGLYEHAECMKDLGTICREYSDTLEDVEEKKTYVTKAISYYKAILEGNHVITQEHRIAILSALCAIYMKYTNALACAKYMEKLGDITYNSIHFSKAGFYYLLSNKIEESLRCYNRSLYLNQYNYFAYNNLAQIMCHLGAHHMVYEYRERAIENITKLVKGDIIRQNNDNDIHKEHPIIISNILLDLNYISDVVGHEAIYKRHLEYSELFEKPLVAYNSRKTVHKNEKIRIGYISNDLKQHCIGSLFEPFLSSFNQEKFEVFVYSNNETTDSVQTRFKSYPVTWNDISKMADVAVVELAHKQQIDIMVDLSGHTGLNRLNLFCYRLAPVQLTYLAYPNTTGLQNMDYKFVDDYLVTDKCQEYHTEKLYSLPHGIHTYTPNKEDFMINRGDSDGIIRFGCFNNPIKFGERCMKAYCDILKLVPKSILYIRYNHCNNQLVRGCIMNKFKYHGIPESQLDIDYAPTKHDYIQLYNKIDICLDSFPYGSHTTLCELLWMSVPLVTLKGDCFAGRVGYSMMKHLGLDELIAETVDEYISKVVELANDRERLDVYHKTIVEKIKSHPMSDSSTFMKSIEDAYEDMHGKVAV
jgi:predicted O-linked N-acetylglucosamine transferase (SPINDLY family)